MASVLRTDSLTKVYGKNTVVDHVSMNIEQGDIYGLIGRNGAGKTTLMKMIGGVAAPTSGAYEFFGEKDNTKTLSRIGCLIESPSLYPELTVWENMMFYNKLLGITDKKNIDEILDYVGISEAKKKKTKQLSLGMKQRLGIGIALIGYPDMLILDEPINGLDPTGIVDIRNLLLKLNKEKGVTLLISSHILGELERLATRFGVIDRGVLVDEIKYEELLEKTRKAVRIEGLDPRKVAVTLEEMKLNDYKVIDGGKVMVYCDIGLSGKINRALGEKGMYAESIGTVGQDLETYFIEKMGGGVQNA
ncbi:MAG: ATP-binding cassette domain-containing protein [Lachnospiraceae bacterium]|nr:ATP-binding cassette domain-containing protein [Lachnospiraceae bacterium]